MNSRSERGSLSEAVYDGVRREILAGHYRPNQRLVETAIAERLGASRTPVREALLRLVNEGLAIRTPHGLIVREFTLQEIRDIYEVRAALEGFAARLLASRATHSDLLVLQDRHQRLVATARDDGIDRIGLVHANAEFHSAVLQTAGNPRLVKMATANLAYFFNTEVAALTSEESLGAAIQQHSDIVQAIASGDGDAADAAARAHVAAGLRTIETQHIGQSSPSLHPHLGSRPGIART